MTSVTWWLGWTVIGPYSIFFFHAELLTAFKPHPHSSPCATHLNKPNKKAQVLTPWPLVRSSKPLVRTLSQPPTTHHKNSRRASSSGSVKSISEGLAANLFFPASLIIWVINLYNCSWDVCAWVSSLIPTSEPNFFVNIFPVSSEWLQHLLNDN